MRLAPEYTGTMSLITLALLVDLDFNNQIEGGTSFKLNQRSYLQKIELVDHYAAFIKKTLPDDEEEDGEAVKPSKKRGAPITVDLNEFGEPIIPNLATLPSSLKPHKHYPNLIRSIMRHDLGGYPLYSSEASHSRRPQLARETCRWNMSTVALPGRRCRGRCGVSSRPSIGLTIGLRETPDRTACPCVARS